MSPGPGSLRRTCLSTGTGIPSSLPESRHPPLLSLGEPTQESEPHRATGECRHITQVSPCTGSACVKKPSRLRPWAEALLVIECMCSRLLKTDVSLLRPQTNLITALYSMMVDTLAWHRRLCQPHVLPLPSHPTLQWGPTVHRDAVILLGLCTCRSHALSSTTYPRFLPWLAPASASGAAQVALI